MKKAVFDEVNNIIVLEFSGRPNLDEFKEVAMSALELLKQHKAGKILNDTSQLEIVSIENQDWTQEVWFPEAGKLGLKHFAFLMPSDIFGQVSAQQANEKAESEGAIRIKYFDSKDEAVEWLVNAG